MRNVIVADLTRCYPHLLDPIGRAIVSMAAGHVPPAEVIAIVNPEQESAVRTVGISRLQIVRSGDALSIIDALLTAMPDARITVAAHNTLVLNLARSRNAVPLHFNELAGPRPMLDHSRGMFSSGLHTPTSATLSFGSPKAVTWVYSHLCTEEHALSVMKSALQNMGAFNRERAVSHVDIRPEMTRIDSRFRGKAIQTNTMGMMTVLLEKAKSQGLIHEEVLSAKDRRIWLVNGAAASAGSLEESRTTETVEQVVSEPAPAASALVPLTSTSDATPKLRSYAWGDLVKAARMGPFPDARHRLYSHLEKQRGLPLATLIAKAISEVRAELNTRQPWPDIQEFLERVLVSLDLVVWEEAPRTPKDASFARVKEFKSEWTVALDAAIVMTIFNQIKWIEGNLQDRRDLARVLYRNSGEEWQARAWAALRYLVKTQSLTEDETGFSLRSETPIAQSHGIEPLATPSRDCDEKDDTRSH